MRKWKYISIGLLLLLIGVVAVGFRGASNSDAVTTDGNVSMEVAKEIALAAKKQFRHEVLSSVEWRDVKQLPFHWRRYWHTRNFFVGARTEDAETTYKVVVWEKGNQYEYSTYEFQRDGNGWKFATRSIAGSRQLPRK
jgi:hypothetical protein